MSEVAAQAPLLRMEGIQKSFPGVRAIADGQLTLHRGEVLALMGENGAGKSTLIKVLSGAHKQDAGTIKLDGDKVDILSPVHAQRLGIAVIYQEFNLVPALSVRENIYLGREFTSLGMTRHKEERLLATELFERMNVHIDPDAVCSDLTVAQQQLVEIAKALSQDARIIVMDEPTATLTGQEVEKLFAIIRDLQSEGVGIIYISHRLDEIFQIADTVTVMRDGHYIDSKPVTELTRERIIEMMVGRTLDSEFPKRAATVGEEALRVEDIRRGKAVNGVSFSVRCGEILGLTGLVGAGRTETARLIFGADALQGGAVYVRGEQVHLKSPQEAIKHGICLLTENRKEQGLVLDSSVRANFGLPNLPHLTQHGIVQTATEREHFAVYVDQLRIKIPHQEQAAKNLSGGNQQKVVLAKWLESNSDVLIFDEPTRGIDVGAKYEIYLLMNELAAQGKAIIMISSELPEILGMSDRILVMRDGKIVGEVTDVANATQEQIMELTLA